MSKNSANPQKRASKEWPVVVYLWAGALALLGYLIGETVFRTTKPHLFHWLLALIGGVLGVGAGWL